MTSTDVKSMDISVQESLFLATIGQMGLMPAWQYVMEHNPSANLPYHNNYHLFHVTRLAHDLLAHYGLPHQRTLVMAGLFHDFAHSGGKCSDAANIQAAIEGFEAFVAADLLTKVELPPSAQDEVKQVIQVTEFPFVREPTGAVTKCLRDADLLFTLSEATTEQVMSGLRQEMEVSQDRTIGLPEMLKQQMAFLPSVEMYTPVAKIIWEQCYPIALQRQKEYVWNNLTPRAADDAV